MTTYSKTEGDDSLSLKANQLTTFTNAEVNSSLSLKADQATIFTKTAVNSSLSLKANQWTTCTKSEVDTHFSNLVDSAPEALNTLNELTDALNDDSNYATTIQNLVSNKTKQHR